MSQNLPNQQDVYEAYGRIKDRVVKTPLIENHHLNEICGGRVLLKAENLQHTGSFKYRGANNALLALSDEEKAKGVIACSSGNHAQGVAEVARLLGVRACILMPEDAPANKIARTKRSGAEVVLYDRSKVDREELIKHMVAERQMHLIHPFNDRHVIAGQGTIALEVKEQLADLNVVPDHLLTCVGGGGLICGIALGIAGHFQDLAIHSCEPENFDDYARSLKAGSALRNDILSGSICDAIITPEPGEISFAICKDLLAEGFCVSDEEALAASQFAFEELKLVVEPGGAVALASLLSGKLKLNGQVAVAILTGGNMDKNLLVT